MDRVLCLPVGAQCGSDCGVGAHNHSSWENGATSAHLWHGSTLVNGYMQAMLACGCRDAERRDAYRGRATSGACHRA
eukprot:15460456-Alexandrium_andersonii.AAC.1